MTKSDRRRVEEALKRWEAKWDAAFNAPGGSPVSVLAAAVDWMRAMTKLAAEYLDPEDTGWTDEKCVTAAMVIAGLCREFRDEILDEAKKVL